jgi:phage gp45-like
VAFAYITTATVTATATVTGITTATVTGITTATITGITTVTGITTATDIRNPSQLAAQLTETQSARRLEAVRCIDALFEIERSINGRSAEQR